MQRRQYFEMKDTEPEWFVNLVEAIYATPHQAVEEVKARLNNLQLSEQQKIEKAREIMEEIRDIGENAQRQRPDL